MKYIRDTYRVPAKRGVRVKYCGELGTIIGSTGSWLRVRPDDGGQTMVCHPTWSMEYLEGGK